MERRSGRPEALRDGGFKPLYTALTALNVGPLCFQTVALPKVFLTPLKHVFSGGLGMKFLNFTGVSNMNNIEMIKENATVAQETARKIFLAGLGAYGKGFEEAKSRFETLSTDSNKMFADLVKKGESLETEGKSKFDDAKTKVTAKADLNNRVVALRSKLGLDQNEADIKIEELNTKIDALTKAVAKLAKAK